jgi:hypothetical protein
MGGEDNQISYAHLPQEKGLGKQIKFQIKLICNI